jgi:hypothetical protein
MRVNFGHLATASGTRGSRPIGRGDPRLGRGDARLGRGDPRHLGALSGARRDHEAHDHRARFHDHRRGGGLAGRGRKEGAARARRQLRAAVPGEGRQRFLLDNTAVMLARHEGSEKGILKALRNLLACVLMEYAAARSFEASGTRQDGSIETWLTVRTGIRFRLREWSWAAAIALGPRSSHRRYRDPRSRLRGLLSKSENRGSGDEATSAERSQYEGPCPAAGRRSIKRKCA